MGVEGEGGTGGFGELCVPVIKSWLRPWPSPRADNYHFSAVFSL